MKSLAILVAEDEVLTRLDIRGMLERAGHVICGECGNGRKAVELARQMMPDLALLDIMMPELDGIETAKILHGMNIPVVMLTAYSQPHIINRAENVHVCGYLVKPVSEHSLQATIRIAHARWLDMQHMRRELSETKIQLQHQKIIARAKTILIAQAHISEQAAHQRLIRDAMELRLSLVEMAQNVISGEMRDNPPMAEKKVRNSAKTCRNSQIT